MEAPSGKGDHLCVLVHGLWGNPTHLQYVASALRACYDQSILQILIVKRNSGTFTYDGIETGGERVTREIEDAIEEYARNGVEIRKISIVGYSLDLEFTYYRPRWDPMRLTRDWVLLGGLVARYAIGLLFSKGYFERIEPVNFCTFATPHLGVRTPLLGWHNHIWNVLGARTLSASGRQLFTIDDFRNTGRPLLSILADKDSVFYRGLSMFPNKVLYANVVNDRSTNFYTSGISRFDPFADLSSVSVNYVSGYSPIIVDPDSPVSPSTKEDEKLPKTTTGVATGLPMVLIYSLVIPIGVVVFLLNALVQTFSSKRRIRLHSSDESLDYHGLPLLVEEMQEAAEGIIEDIHHEMSPQHLPASSEESISLSPVSTIFPALGNKKTVSPPDHRERVAKMHTDTNEHPYMTNQPDDAKSSTSVTAELQAPPTPESLTVDEDERDDESNSTGEEIPKQRQMEFPTLALTPHQFEMIASLEKLGIRKFPVYIHNDKHSHAAIIVRKPWSKKWEEGKVVVGHWLNEAFVV